MNGDMDVDADLLRMWQQLDEDARRDYKVRFEQSTKTSSDQKAFAFDGADEEGVKREDEDVEMPDEVLESEGGFTAINRT